MVLESLTNPFNAENNPKKMILLGFLYATVGIFLSINTFKAHSSLVMVFLTAMSSIPLIYNTIIMEEEKDLTGLEESWILKEHSKALKVFIYLFIGITIAFSLWYVFLDSSTISFLFKTQSNVINSINTPTGNFSNEIRVFSKIFLNNVRVLVFCILFSFLFGSGAIFILSWNASVIGAAIGNLIRTELSKISSIGGYFSVVSYGLLKYSIHGIPEILAYFIGGLAGGIISIAIIKHDVGTKKFENIILDSVDLIILSLIILFIAAILEVWVTPIIFN